MARIARVVVPSFLHHVTQRGNRQERVFFDDTDRLFFTEKLRFYAVRAGLQLASHCLMNNHAHLLVVPENHRSLERALKPLHMCYSQHLNRRFGRSGLNWQGRYFSSPLDDQHAWCAFQYVALNPVNAGMVSSFQAYPWSTASSLLLGAPSPYLTADSKWLEMGRMALLEIAHGQSSRPNQAMFEALEEKVLKNFPVGSPEFVEKLEQHYGLTLRPKPLGRPRRTESR
jgi:putative transposase